VRHSAGAWNTARLVLLSLSLFCGLFVSNSSRRALEIVILGVALPLQTFRLQPTMSRVAAPLDLDPDYLHASVGLDQIQAGDLGSMSLSMAF